MFRLLSRLATGVLLALTLPAIAAAGPRSGADVGVTVAASSTQVRVGEEVTITASVANAGPESARGVGAEITLPRTGSLVSATPSRGSCATAGWSTTPESVRCDLGDLARRASATVRVVLRATEGGTMTGTATAYASQTADPDDRNNAAGFTVSVPGSRRLGECTMAVRPHVATSTFQYTGSPTSTCSFSVSATTPAELRVSASPTLSGPTWTSLCLYGEPGEPFYRRCENLNVRFVAGQPIDPARVDVTLEPGQWDISVTGPTIFHYNGAWICLPSPCVPRYYRVDYAAGTATAVIWTKE